MASHIITAIEVRDIQRLRHVKFKPEADAALILIGGKNAQGKTSLLRALQMAIGGKGEVPADPVRHGAEDGEVTIELDGEITICRKVTADGNSRLELRSPLGPIRSPQAFLDRLFAGRFLDPLAFLNRKAPEQRADLLRLIDRDGKIAGIDSNRRAVFDRRTEVGRDLKKATAQLEGTPDVQPGTAIDVAALTAERAQIEEVKRKGGELAAAAREAEYKHTNATGELRGLDEQIADLRRRLAEAEARREVVAEAKATAERELASARSAMEAARTEWSATIAPRLQQIDSEIARAQEHNRKVAADEAAAAQRKRLAEQVAELRSDHKALDEEIARYDDEKAKILAAAELPVPGLGVTDDAVTLNGVPLEQASGAERWRVAIGIAIAAKPVLRDVWIRDGALLDDDSLAMLAKLAQETGYRFWIERVGTRDPGAIIIHDGQRIDDAPASQQQLDLGGVR